MVESRIPAVARTLFSSRRPPYSACCALFVNAEPSGGCRCEFLRGLTEKPFKGWPRVHFYFLVRGLSQFGQHSPDGLHELTVLSMRLQYSFQSLDRSTSRTVPKKTIHTEHQRFEHFSGDVRRYRASPVSITLEIIARQKVERFNESLTVAPITNGSRQATEMIGVSHFARYYLLQVENAQNDPMPFVILPI